LEEDSAEAKEYLQEHDQACRWAKASRDLIALRFLSCLEPGEPVWSLGKNSTDAGDVHDAILCAKIGLSTRRVVDIWHNNVERVRWPPTPPTQDANERALTSSASQSNAYIHRKGAAPTLSPSTSLPLPILPLPGSRGTPTLILRPEFPSSTSHGLQNAFSLAHGAGRSMSRAKALASLSQKYKASSLLEPKGGKGTWVVCEQKDLVFEEAPEAYKDVEAVGQDLVDFGAARRVGWCRARVSYKCRDERGKEC
jgi:RNA-splicing ligase RtcB